MSSSKVVTICADYRERGSKVVTELLSCPEEVKVEIKPLEVADFIVSDRVGIERKSANDFIQSIIDRRLFKQIEQLKESFSQPAFIIEGESLYRIRDIHPNAVRGALSFIAILNGIPVLRTVDEEDTAAMLIIMARQEQLDLGHNISLRPKRKPLSLDEQQRNIIECLPNIGPILSRYLLKHFGNIEKIMLASEEELKQVRLIGKVRAHRIKELLLADYVE